MYTVDTVLESLQKFDIRESDIALYEKELGLAVPVDEYGRKIYSPHHINLFKNIRKHMAMGRTLDDIRNIISLPPLKESQPKRRPPAMASAEGGKPGKNYASVPIKPSIQPRQGKATITGTAQTAIAGPGAASVVELVNQLTRQKDTLYKKLMETEKLNSHLYSANSMFHRRMKEMNTAMDQLRKQMRQNGQPENNLKVLDDKARLQKQILSAERLVQLKEDELRAVRQEMQSLQKQVTVQEDRIQGLKHTANPDRFCGDWMESGKLLEISYDNFGINIEPERMRLFRIAERPQRVFGGTATITTTYQYETNNLWKRNETLVVSLVDEDRMEGELVAEYVMDGVPVAKAIYRITCTRQTSK